MDGDADPRSALSLLGDVFVVVGAIVLAFAATVLPAAHPLRVLLTLPTLLLAPGYAITLAVFPGTGASDRRSEVDPIREASNRPAGLDGIERLALAFGLSVVSLPLIAMALAAGGFAYEATPVLIAVAVFTALVLAVGSARRFGTSPAFRYAPSARTLRTRLARFTDSSSADGVLNVVLLVVAVSAVASLGVAVSAPQDGSTYTQVSLLAEDTSGELSASGYPTNLTRNQVGDVVLSVTNREDRPTTYTVAVQLQQVGPDGGVVSRSELDRFSLDTDSGTTTRVRHEFRVPRVGDDQRVAYLLYRGDAPDDPTFESAYRKTYLWVDVRPLGTSDTDPGAVAGTDGDGTRSTTASGVAENRTTTTTGTDENRTTTVTGTDENSTTTATGIDENSTTNASNRGLLAGAT